MAFYLAIVSPLDAPLFELQFTTSRAAGTAVSAGFPTWSSFTESASAAVAAAGTSATPSGSTPATPAPATGEVGVAQGAPGDRNILQMIAHAGLDAVEEVAEGSGTL
jgi:hypothetical protein